MFQNWTLKWSATIVFIASAIAIPAAAQLKEKNSAQSVRTKKSLTVKNGDLVKSVVADENNDNKENSSDDSVSSMDVESSSNSQEKEPLEDITNAPAKTTSVKGCVKSTPFTGKTLKRTSSENNNESARPDMIYAIVFPSEQKLDEASDGIPEFSGLPYELRFDLLGRTISDEAVFHELVAALLRMREWLVANNMLVYVGETARLARQYEHTSRMNNPLYHTREYKALRALAERLIQMAQLAQSDANVVIPFQGFVFNVREQERHLIEGLVIYILRANFDGGINANSGAQDLVLQYLALYQGVLGQSAHELAMVTIPNTLALTVQLPGGQTSQGMALLPDSVNVPNCVYSLSNAQIPLHSHEIVDLTKELSEGGALHETNTFGALFEFLAKRFGAHREFVQDRKVSAYFGQTNRPLQVRSLEEAQAVSLAPGRRVSMGIADTLMSGGVVLSMHWVHQITESLLKVVEAFMIDFFQTDQGCRGWNSLPGNRKDFDDDDNLPGQGNFKRPRLRLF